MKIILLQDVENLGKKGEIKEVKEGFARNYLFPKNLAQLATAQALKKAQLEKQVQEKRVETLRREAEAQAKKLQKQIFIIPAKAGTEGKLFGSVTSEQIASQIFKELGIKVDPKDVELTEPIKKIGEYKIKVKLFNNIEAKVKLAITKQNKVK